MEKKEYRPDKLWNKYYIILLIINFFIYIAFYMLNPTIPKYAVNLGYSLTVAGLISGCFSIMALIVRPFSGAISDRYNIRNVSLLSTALIGVAALGYVLSGKIVGLLFFRLLHGLAFGISGIAIVTLISYYIPEDKMGDGIGCLGLSQIIAMSFAPNLGLQSSNLFGYKITFAIAACIVSIAVILLFVIKFPGLSVKNEVPKSKLKLNQLFAKEVICLAIIVVAFSLTNSLESSFIAMYAEERKISGYHMYFTVSAVFLLVSRLLSGKIADRKGLKAVLYPAFFGVVAGMIILWKANTLWMFLLAAAIKALGHGAGQPSIQAACIKKVPKERRGSASGTYYLGVDIGQGIGPVIGGFVAGHFGYNNMYLMGGCITVMAMALFAVYTKGKE